MKPNYDDIDPAIVKTINKLNKLPFIKRTLFSCAGVGPRPKSQHKDGFGKTHSLGYDVDIYLPSEKATFVILTGYHPYIAFQCNEKLSPHAKKQMKTFLSKISKISNTEEWTTRYKNAFGIHPVTDFHFKNENDVYIWWNKINKIIDRL